MGVFGAGEDFKTRHHLAGDVVLREHTPDSFLDHAVRVAGAHLGGAETLKAVAETAVALIFLLLFLVARELDLSGVRDDNEAAGVDGRIKRGEILGAEFVGDNDGDTAERLALRVDEEPLAVVAGVRSTIALLHLYFPFFTDLCPLSRVLSAVQSGNLSRAGKPVYSPDFAFEGIFYQKPPIECNSVAHLIDIDSQNNLGRFGEIGHHTHVISLRARQFGPHLGKRLCKKMFIAIGRILGIGAEVRAIA